MWCIFEEPRNKDGYSVRPKNYIIHKKKRFNTLMKDKRLSHWKKITCPLIKSAIIFPLVSWPVVSLNCAGSAAPYKI